VSGLLLLKLTVTPLLVAVMSLIARRLGPTFAGLIMGLPWMTGPVIFFLTWDNGRAWSAEASLGATIAVVPIGCFLLGYALFIRTANVLVCWLVAITSFAACGWAMLQLELPLHVAAPAGIAGLLATRFLLPKPRTDAGPGPLPWWDIPMRMVATALMVAIINAVSGFVGPDASGIIASYPVILTAVGGFIHIRWGPDAVLRLFAGLSVSLISFVVFFSVVAAHVEAWGVELAYAAAVLAGVTASGCLMAINQTLVARQKRRATGEGRLQ